VLMVMFNIPQMFIYKRKDLFYFLISMAVYNTSMFFLSSPMPETEKCQNICIKCIVDMRIVGDSGGQVNILGGDSISYYEKKVHMNMCLILNGYQDTAV
jgi:hypothetical protein